MLRITRPILALAALAVCLFCAAPALAQSPPSSIQLFMPGGGGTPSRNIRMTLVSDTGFVDIVVTDSKGKYLLRTPRGVSSFYTVTIDSDGQTYGTTTARVRFDAGNPIEIAIFLNPYVPPKSAKTGVIDVSEFEANIPSSARAAYKRGMTFISEGNLEQAINSLEEAVADYPQYVRALNDLGVTLMKVDRLDEAAERLRSAVDIGKRLFHPRMNLGVVLNRQHKYKESVEVLDPLYHEYHTVVEVNLAYAEALDGEKKFADAENVYRAVMAAHKIDEKIYNLVEFKLGVLLNRAGRFREAAAELENVVTRDATIVNAHLQLGGALMQLQRLDRAESELLRAYELGGASAGAAQLLLGHVYYQQRRLKDAERAFEQYLNDVPSAPNATQVRTLIATLRSTKS
jgi:tetratricopeptide (TPR) repeat protein